MRRFLVLLLVLGLGVVIGRMFDGVGSTAVAGGDQGRGGAVSGNGDVNGDGVIDISDASYLLTWLFLGGPEPEPCESGGGELLGLPDTGALCYDQDGNEVDCKSDSCTGQDGQYATGCPSEGRYLDNGDGTVTDTCTGLMWQKDRTDTDNDGIADDTDRLPWCDALAYCENLELGGRDDWRLPNVRELHSIVDYGRPFHLGRIDPVFRVIEQIQSDYWSSTAQPLRRALFVNFFYGHVGNGSMSREALVRAVRGGL